MAAMGEDQRLSKAPVIETASGTTDPNNARSGFMPYVIAGGTIVLLMLLGGGLAGLFDMAGTYIDTHWTGHSNPSGPNTYYYNYEDLQNFEDYENYENYDDPLEFINQYYNDEDSYTYYDNGQIVEDGASGQSGTISQTDALGAELEMYQATIDAALPQSAYANAQESVRTFVRSLVISDRDATSSMASALHSAAWNDGDVKAALAEATKTAQDTAAAIEALEIPQVEGEKAAEVQASLEEGRTHAVERWNAISAELELLSSADELDLSTLNDADGLVAQAASDAAEDFAQAMSDSIHH